MSPTVSIVPPGRVGVGIQLPVQALSSRVAAPWEHEAGSDELVRVARAADRAGFLYVAVCDHVAVPRPNAETMSTTWYDPVSTLSYLAGQTTTTRLMTNVYVVAYRHPLQIAKTFATLDHLSGGRVLLGVGAGHVEGEFDALDVSFAGRGAITDEAIDAIRACWSEEFPEHHGARWSFADVGQRPRPVQQPRPPIWVGGSGPPALRRVATRGDGWIPQGTPRHRMPEQIDAIRRHRDEVRPDAEPELGYITEFVHVGEPDRELPFPQHTVQGSGEQIADSFAELTGAGVSHLQLRFACRSADELCDQIEAFGAEVLPLLTRA